MSGDDFHNGSHFGNGPVGHGDSGWRDQPALPKHDAWPTIQRKAGPPCTITYQVSVHGQFVDIGSVEHWAAMQRAMEVGRGW